MAASSNVQLTEKEKKGGHKKSGKYNPRKKKNESMSQGEKKTDETEIYTLSNKNFKGTVLEIDAIQTREHPQANK